MRIAYLQSLCARNKLQFNDRRPGWTGPFCSTESDCLLHVVRQCAQCAAPGYSTDAPSFAGQYKSATVKSCSEHPPPVFYSLYFHPTSFSCFHSGPGAPFHSFALTTFASSNLITVQQYVLKECCFCSRFKSPLCRRRSS